MWCLCLSVRVKNSDTSKFGPGRLHGSNLEFWRQGVWVECLVSSERNAELLAQYPPEKEWGRPGILYGDYRTLSHENPPLQVGRDEGDPNARLLGSGVVASMKDNASRPTQLRGIQVWR